MPDVDKNDKAGRDADCQAKDVYQRKCFMLKQVSPGDPEVVFDHGQQWLGELRCTMLKIIHTVMAGRHCFRKTITW
jgi:hypothetical protein